MCIFHIIFTLFAFAENSDKTRIIRIKSNSIYYWAIAEAENREEALQRADRELAEQIGGVALISKTDWYQQSKIMGNKNEYISDFKDQIKTFTGIYLKGLMHITVKEQEIWSALSYIHKDSLAVSFQLRKKKIREFHQQAISAAEKGRVGESLRNLYWGFLLSLAFPDTLHLPLHEGKISEIPKVAINCLLNATMEDIEISAGECYQDGPTIIAPLRVTFRGKQVSELSFQYYSGGEGMDWGLFEDGIAEIPFYDEPSSPTRRLSIKIEYTYDNDMRTDEEIAGLFEIFKESRIDNRKNVTLYFPWIEEVELDKITVIPIVKEEKPFPIDEEDEYLLPVVENMDADTLFLEALELFCELNEVSQLQDYINQYVKLGVLSIGRPEDFGNGVGCYIAIVDGPKLLEILYYNGANYKGLKTGLVYSVLERSFSGKGQLWFRDN